MRAKTKAKATAIDQSFRLRLHSGLRQSGGRLAAVFRRGAEAPLYRRSNDNDRSNDNSKYRDSSLRSE